MSLILKQLDLRSLKKARIVCKSWLLQAQHHLLRRGIVHLRNGTIESLCNAGISKFASVYQNSLRALPLPFQCVDVDLQAVSSPPPALILARLSTLSPPLAVIRFSPGDLSLDLAFPFMIQCSSILEYLHLTASAKFLKAKCNSLILMDSQQLNFPKLRYLKVDSSFGEKSTANGIIHFPSLVARVAKGSPTLEKYESNGFYMAAELVCQLSLQVDIKNVKNLTLWGYRLNTVAFNHLLTIPFTQLQCLEMSVQTEDPLNSAVALTAAVKKCSNSLTTLDLSSYRNITDLKLPVCPNVRELSLRTLKESDGGILSYIFPTLQVVNVRRMEIDLDRNDWDSFSPLFELKTLRVRDLRQLGDKKLTKEDYERIAQASPWLSKYVVFGGYRDYDCFQGNQLARKRIESNSSCSNQLVTFLQKFPGLERLRIPSSALIGVCKDIRDEKCCSSLLEGVKHLELCGSDSDYSPLAILKGLETITLMKFNGSIPVEDLPCLKLLQFPWGPYSDMNTPKLMGLASRVGRVSVTNCCSFPRTGDAQSKELLEAFFELASNAECGCNDGKKIPKMMLNMG